MKTAKTLKAFNLSVTALLFSAAIFTSCTDEKKETTIETNTTEVKQDTTVVMDPTPADTKPVKGGSRASDATESPVN